MFPGWCVEHCNMEGTLSKYLRNIAFQLGNETIQNKAEKQKGGFLSILLSALGASSFGKLLTGKGVKR